jgi:hypothetical protein
VPLLRKDRETLLSALFCNISCRSGSLIQINSISVGTTLLECGYKDFIARLVEPNVMQESNPDEHIANYIVHEL